MYSSINGYIVKCFPIARCSKTKIHYSYGEYRNYETGDKVPFLRPYYNYGRNFVIIDIGQIFGTSHMGSNPYRNYSFVIHVIEDGRVKATYRDNVGEIPWENIQSVIDYYGEFLNIRNNSDVAKFIKEFGEYRHNVEMWSKTKDELFIKLTNLSVGLSPKEKQRRQQEILEVNEEYERERDIVRLKNNENIKELRKKWVVELNSLRDVVIYGEYLYAYTQDREDKEYCEYMVKSMVDADSTLKNRYNTWQQSSDYIKNFTEKGE